jgi:hypothetical protein
VYVDDGGTTKKTPAEEDTMKVHELIEILESMDPDATVLMATQRSYPFENTLHGLVARCDVTDPDEDDDQDEGPFDCAPAGPRSSDVLLLEGEQLRYGIAAAWDAARR